MDGPGKDSTVVKERGNTVNQTERKRGKRVMCALHPAY